MWEGERRGEGWEGLCFCELVLTYNGLVSRDDFFSDNFFEFVSREGGEFVVGVVACKLIPSFDCLEFD